jgi:hypothetical protein
MTISVNAKGQDGHITATGAFDSDRKLLSLSMDMSSLVGSAVKSIPGLDAPIEVIETQDTMYLHFPLFAQLVGTGSDWVSVKTGAASPSSFDVADPTAFLDFVQGTGGAVTVVGREQVRGVDTTHMQATLTLRDALDRAPADQRDRIQRALGQLGQSADGVLDASLPLDVFVDDDGLIRRLAIDFSVPDKSDESGSSGGSASIAIEFFDFGTEVSIEPPPADQVTDVTSTFSQMTGGLIGG